MSAELARFGPEHASTVASWATSAEEAERWCARREHPVDASVFDGWHADRDVHPWLLVEQGVPVGYGEVWEDPGENEAELARVIVAPTERGRGLGRLLVELLSGRARAAGFTDIWVRVLPDNAPALASYGAAGFVRTTEAEERLFNQDQPRGYIWMYLPRT